MTQSRDQNSAWTVFLPWSVTYCTYFSLNSSVYVTSLLCLLSVSLCIEASIVTTSPFLFPESELVTEPEEDEEGNEEDAEEAEDSTQRGVDCPSLADSKF